VIVASFDSEAIAAFRHACPAVATGATPREVARFVVARALAIVRLPELAAVALEIPERYRGLPVLTPRVLTGARARGLRVCLGRRRDAPMRRVLAMGVDGIVTDGPDRLLTLLGRGSPAGVNMGRSSRTIASSVGRERVSATMRSSSL
jgi:glycerophosphoryl diester phosphodiesterase